ncbi:MAG: histidine--tRNA ligase [Chitinophagaceae bacterium]|nr:histidine--tRNA ligase [Chitinophagaceae bacterium]
MTTPPSIPQGTRDFGPDIVCKRNFIFQTIKRFFELYAFQPLETPALEHLDTLMGKYGDEGDKLIFKILNNGLDHPEKQQKAREEFEKILQGKNSSFITERALKYDLTIPLARYVAMNHQRITFPFKRFQIQPVWRADRPQKGRYREFWQCDADIVGSRSSLHEAELALLCHDVFTGLGLKNYSLRVNHRKILAGLCETMGCSEKLTQITTAIDKLEKAGWEKVSAELQKAGLLPQQTDTVRQFISITGTTEEVIKQLQDLMPHSYEAAAGIEDIKSFFSWLKNITIPVVLDPSLARGLDYYTGIIFEIKAPPEVKMGSLGGGGRYDNLTGLFGVTGISGVGISFGIDRIFDVMEELSLFPDSLNETAKLIFFNLGITETEVTFSLARELRNKGNSVDIYPDKVKLDKQFRYAEKKNIQWAVIIGEEEIKTHTAKLKNLKTGVQQTLTFTELLNFSF